MESYFYPDCCLLSYQLFSPNILFKKVWKMLLMFKLQCFQWQTETAAKPHCFIYQWSLQNLTSGILKIFKVGRHMCRCTHKVTTYVYSLIGSIFNLCWKRSPQSHKYLIFFFLLSSSLWKIANRTFEEIELHTYLHWPSCCSELQLSATDIKLCLSDPQSLCT